MEQNDTILSSGLLELYVLGIANEQETAQVTEMAKRDAEVAKEIRAIEKTLELYAAANGVLPSASTKQQLISVLFKDTDKTSNVIPISNAAKGIVVPAFWKYAAAASILLLIASTVLNLNFYNKSRVANNELGLIKNERAQLKNQLVVLEEQNGGMKNDMNVIQSKYSEPVALHGLEAAPDAVAKIFWMRNTGEVYIDPSNLPDAPEGMQYQLWGIVDGQPVDGGLIITTNRDDKYRMHKMKTFGKAEAFAVTLETKGGNTTPKGKMFVLGKM